MSESIVRIDDLAMDASEIRIEPLTELADFDACVQMQLAVWGYSDGDLIPRRVFIVARQIGGQVVGAFVGDCLAGFAMSLPGYRDHTAYMHSHMLAVLPEYRDRGLGRRLKLAQREDALARGFDRIEWTFDPLEIKNAYLNIARLGAIARRYLPDFYGHSTSPLQGGLPTDRLLAEWWLRSERVRRTLGVSGEKKAGQAGDFAPISVQVTVPQEVKAWKESPDQRNLAESLQTRNRLALQTAFDRGLAVTGYERSPAGDGRFLLGPLTELETTD